MRLFRRRVFYVLFVVPIATVIGSVLLLFLCVLSLALGLIDFLVTGDTFFIRAPFAVAPAMCRKMTQNWPRERAA